MIGIDTVTITSSAEAPPETLEWMKVLGGKVVKYENVRRASVTHYAARIGGDTRDERMPRVTYSEEKQNIKVTIPSLPYFIHGCSVTPVTNDDLPFLYETLETLLQKGLGFKLEEKVSDWHVHQCDVYHDFQVGALVPDYIQAISASAVPTYKRNVYEAQTVAFKNSSSSMQFYHKQQQLMEKGAKAEEIAAAQGVLRFEVGLKARNYREAFEQHSWPLKDVLDQEKSDHWLRYYLQKLNMDGLRVATDLEVWQTLQGRLSNNLAAGIFAWLSARRMGVPQCFSASTQRRYENLLREVGCAPCFSEKALPPLVLHATR